MEKRIDDDEKAIKDKNNQLLNPPHPAILLPLAGPSTCAWKKNQSKTCGGGETNSDEEKAVRDENHHLPFNCQVQDRLISRIHVG